MITELDERLIMVLTDIQTTGWILLICAGVAVGIGSWVGAHARNAEKGSDARLVLIAGVVLAHTTGFVLLSIGACRIFAPGAFLS